MKWVVGTIGDVVCLMISLGLILQGVGYLVRRYDLLHQKLRKSEIVHEGIKRDLDEERRRLLKLHQNGVQEVKKIYTELSRLRMEGMDNKVSPPLVPLTTGKASMILKTLKILVENKCILL